MYYTEYMQYFHYPLKYTLAISALKLHLLSLGTDSLPLEDDNDGCPLHMDLAFLLRKKCKAYSIMFGT